MWAATVIFQARAADRPETVRPDSNGKTAVRPIVGAGNTLFPVSILGRSGFIKTDGTLAIPAILKNAREFHEELAAAQLGKNWGFINTAGKWVISPSFDCVGDFHEGLAWFYHGTQRGFVDTNGKTRFTLHDSEDFLHDESRNFSEGCAVLRRGKSVYFVDVSRRKLFSSDFDFAGPFRSGLAKVITHFGNSLLDGFEGGFINHQGAFVIGPTKFQSLEGFSEGKAFVRTSIFDGHYINIHGERLNWPISIERVLPFNDGVAAVRDSTGSWWTIREDGNPITSLDDVDEVLSYSEGIFRVKSRDRFGFITTSGDWLTPTHYTEADDFHNKVARVATDGFNAYIDQSGKQFWHTPVQGHALPPRIDWAHVRSSVPSDLLNQRLSVQAASLRPLIEEVRGHQFQKEPDVRTVSATEFRDLLDRRLFFTPHVGGLASAEVVLRS